MPFVPQVAGVPPLTSYLVGAVSLLVSDIIGLFFGSTSQWGLFDALTGSPVVIADSVISFDYKQDYTVSDYTVEKGAFESYDKVRLPFEVMLRFASGGNSANRSDLLDSIESIMGDLNLYNAVTPDAIYLGVNAFHQDYKRTAKQGVGLVSVDLRVREIRVAPNTQFSNTQSPSGANPIGGGGVTPVDTGSGSSSGGVRVGFPNTGQGTINQSSLGGIT